MLCTFSEDQYAHGSTRVDNVFITDFMPLMTESSVRVYLYGLFLCGNPLGEDNTFERMCEGLQMTPEELRASIGYLKSLGLITVASTEPLLLRFNSPRKAVSPNRLYNKDKYSDFLVDLHVLFADKELSETEIGGYLDFLEETKMQQDALLLIIKNCIDAKGSNIGRSYVLTVAKNWYNEGVVTLQDAENRVLEAEASGAQIREVLKALKSKRAADVTDRQLYLKWTGNMGFSFDAVLAAAKLVKRGGIEKLDVNLENYAKQGILTADDIKEYDRRRKEMLDCTIKANKILGLHYEDCTYLAETYVADWFAKGFTTDSVLMIARYCVLNGVRDFVGLADAVIRFYGEGYVTLDSVRLQLDALTRMDESIEKIIYASGSTRRVTPQDRDLYRTWTERWRLTDEQILSVAMQAQGKAYAMSWISSRLADTLGGTPWVKEFQAPKPQKTGLGDFEKAEIKAKLKEDGVYSSLLTQTKKLEFEMSAFLAKGEEAPLVMREQLQELKAQTEERVKALGYDPDALA